MRRLVLLATMLSLLIVPLSLALPQTAGAQSSPLVIHTVERGSGAPVLYVCYGVRDLGRGGDIAGACDQDDGNADGTTTLTTGWPECSNCRISQSIRENPNTGLPLDHLREPPLEGVSWSGGPYTFQNYLKPFLVVSAVDATTGALVPGACINVGNLSRGGGVGGGCDGDSFDQDNARNGMFKTKRLNLAYPYVGPENFRVSQTSPPPPGYELGARVDTAAGPAETDEFVHVILPLTPKPAPPPPLPTPARLTIKTVDSKTNRRLNGACYVVKDQSHGGSLGRICDGVKQGAGGDQDGRSNGVIVIKRLPGGHTYVIDQKKAPQGYRLFAGDKRVVTVAGSNETVTFKNRPKP